MKVYNIITAICLALLTAAWLYVAYKIIISTVRKRRADRIAFIRGFKKGKCIAIFIVAIPLLCLGYIYGGSTVFDGILNAIAHVVDFVVLKFSIGKVDALLSASFFYRFTFYYCCTLVILNAILFAFSFIGQQLWLFWNSLVRFFTRKEKLFIFGYNENSVSVYKSNKTFCAAIIDNVSNEIGLELYKRKISFISRHDYSGFIDRILKRACKNKKCTIVINTENDEINLNLCNLFAGKLKALNNEQREKQFANLRIYVFGNPKYEALYCDIVSASFGCIRYKNKYQMLAMDFIDKYPLTKFMDDRQIDYKTALIKPDVDINVCMIGFGKPNRQILLTSVANNQFLTKTKSGVDLKQVNYHIFDKVDAENNKNLNHMYYRFKNEFVGVNVKDYLPLPAEPAKEEPYHLDINSPDFYKKIHEIIGNRLDDANFIIVSFESDLENIDMAQKLVEKRREWGISNLTIFVRTKKSHADNFVFREENVFFIGNENECVYDIDQITKDKIFKMAQMRNEIYDLEYTITHDKDFSLTEEAILQNRINANKNWFCKKSQLERESSLYCCLSLQSKLNLMGLEYCKKEDNKLPALEENEYIEEYAENDLPDIETFNLTVDDKKVVNYTLDFPESRRRNLAILEHLRWNSFMITKGMVPATKEQILNEMIEADGKVKHSNGKNYRLRRHGNLTTFDGLVEFRKMVAERDNVNEIDCDVIKYDYQLLDDAYWLLDKNEYKIVRRSGLQKNN